RFPVSMAATASAALMVFILARPHELATVHVEPPMAIPPLVTEVTPPSPPVKVPYVAHNPPVAVSEKKPESQARPENKAAPLPSKNKEKIVLRARPGQKEAASSSRSFDLGRGRNQAAGERQPSDLAHPPSVQPPAPPEPLAPAAGSLQGVAEEPRGKAAAQS